MKEIIITCNEKLKIKVLDEQHSQLADNLNNVFKAFYSNNHKDLKAALKMLVEHIRIHFETEERLMVETKFLGYITHKLEHDRFFNKTLIIYNTFCKNKLTINEEHIESMRNWFYNHIEINDKKCGAHFAKQGIK